MDKIQAMRWTAPVLLVLLLGCGENRAEDEEAARAAFAAFLEALSSGNGAGLWALADEETKGEFDKLVTEVKEALSLVDRYYPEADRANARKNLLGDLIGPDTTGEKLFLALLDTQKIKAPDDPDARTIERVIVGKETVRIVTVSGDTVEFKRGEDGQCKSDVLLKAFRDVPGLATLRENVAIVKQNRDIIERTPPAKQDGGQK